MGILEDLQVFRRPELLPTNKTLINDDSSVKTRRQCEPSVVLDTRTPRFITAATRVLSNYLMAVVHSGRLTPIKPDLINARRPKKERTG